MKNSLIALLLVLSPAMTMAQFIKERSINAQIGYGLSAPYDSADDIVNDAFLFKENLS